MTKAGNFFRRLKPGSKAASPLEVLRASPLFDPAWYRETNPDLRGKPIDAAKHYLDHGSAEGRNPHPLFDTRWYLQQNPDVAASGMNPLVHYILHGEKEGRAPYPRPASNAATNRIEYSARRSSQGSNPTEASTTRLSRHDGGLLVSEIDASTDKIERTKERSHWLELSHARWKGKFKEVRTFAEELYLTTNPDVAGLVRDGHLQSGCQHWLNNGIVEDLCARRKRSPLFSEVFYRKNNPDVVAALTNGEIPSAYHHFLMFGFSEGRQGVDAPPWSRIPQVQDVPALNAKLSALDSKPLVSIIVPVYNTNKRLLERCIDSVREQVYPNWELCLVDDGSSEPQVRSVLTSYAANEIRIKTWFFDANRGISAASNAALALAGGDWIALLDHDDELAPDALLEVACAISANPKLELIYTDEDKISEDGKVCYDFNLKPDWSPDLLLSTMYIGHLTVYRRSLLEKAGGFRSEYDETQDYDLALRVSRLAKYIHHIPKRLYHWRATPTSAASNINAKPNALIRQKAALVDALETRGAQGRVTAPAIGWWRVVYDAPTPHPLVTVVIPTAGYSRNVEGKQINLIINCVHSLIESDCYDNFEIVVVENGNLPNETRAALQQIPQVRSIQYSNKKFNFCEKLNFGVEASRGEYVLLLNDDTEAVTPRFLHDMVGLASQPGVGAVGAKLLFSDGRIQHVGIVMTNKGPTHALIGEHASVDGPHGMANAIHNAFGATAACLLVKKEFYLTVGGFDERFGPIYNDVDFCLKLRARGLRIVIDPSLLLYHFESLSKSGDENWEFYLEALLQRWKVFADPYVNPNYKSDSPYFEFKNQDRFLPEDFDIALRRRIALPRLTDGPVKFSVIVGIYNTSHKFLTDLEQSVLMQFYENFEFIIADDASNRPETLRWLKSIADHPKVRVIRLGQNRGIMGAYGAAFHAATGDYVLPIDHDDFLTLDALAIMAEAIIANGRPALLYSDECKSNTKSALIHPFHKPDWDPILFSNICYCCHLGCIRRNVAIETRCFEDERATWSYDWDYYWRIYRAGYTPIHVPEVIYAWRIHSGSTAAVENSNRLESADSQKYVLGQQLSLSGWSKCLEIVPNELFQNGGMWRLRPKGLPDDVCLVLSVDGQLEEELEKLLIKLLGIPTLRIFAVAESEQTRLDSFYDMPRVSVANTLANALSKAADEGEFVCWLESQSYPRNDHWLTESAGLLAAIEDAVAVGGRVIGRDERVLWAGGFFGINGGIDSSDFGLAANNSGYHGMGLCQRTVDGVPRNHWVTRSTFLSAVLDEFAVGVTPAALATAIALHATRERKRILYTPFDEMLTIQSNVRPSMPLERLSAASHYHSPQLSVEPPLYWKS